MPNLPTEPGFYWHRDIDEGDSTAYNWEVLEVQWTSPNDDRVLVECFTRIPVSEMAGEWQPRIPDPDENRELDEHIKHSILTAHNDIRDRLAEKFVVGLLAHRGVVSPTHPTGEVSFLIKDAYAIADAMIAERKKR